MIIVIGVAHGKDLNSLTYLGLIGIIDPPRDGVAEAVSRLMTGGVNVKMITGDSRETAITIAKQIGLPVATRQAMSGEQLDSMDYYGLKDCVEDVSVFYRVSPKNKVQIVKVRID